MLFGVRVSFFFLGLRFRIDNGRNNNFSRFFDNFVMRLLWRRSLDKNMMLLVIGS